jgi:sugar lactone lactonase YvrE
MSEEITMNRPPTVSLEEWEAARQELLVEEKELTRARDALAAKRRRMPWTAVESEYRFEGPNGLVFSPGEERLYVSDTRAGHIRVFDVRDDGTLAGDRVFTEVPQGYGRFDNIRFDDEGRLWAAAMDGGVHCYDPDGTLIGRILVPEPVSNIAFGGAKNNIMFITATTGLYSLMLAVTGARRIHRTP